MYEPLGTRYAAAPPWNAPHSSGNSLPEASLHMKHWLFYEDPWEEEMFLRLSSENYYASSELFWFGPWTLWRCNCWLPTESNSQETWSSGKWARGSHDSRTSDMSPFCLSSPWLPLCFDCVKESFNPTAHQPLRSISIIHKQKIQIVTWLWTKYQALNLQFQL